MLKEIRPAIVMMVCFTVLTGLVYPLAMTGIAQVVFPRQANGSLIEKDKKVIGSELIGQNFTEDKYFHGRPSATTDTDPKDPTKTVPAPYNAANSSGSNAGPTAKSLIERIQGDVDKLKAENPNAAVPGDLVTTSASGLDPGGPPAAARPKASMSWWVWLKPMAAPRPRRSLPALSSSRAGWSTTRDARSRRWISTPS